MATRLTWSGFGLRFLFAVLLVALTYNPEGLSFYHWVIEHSPHFTVFKAFAGVILLIGWVIYLRATMRSLGPLGLGLAIALFGTFIWLLVDMGWVPADSLRSVSYIIMFISSAVLAVGMSWSHIRRRLSGQLDVDDVTEA